MYRFVLAIAALALGIGLVAAAGRSAPVSAQESDLRRASLYAGASNVAYLGPTLSVAEALTNARDVVTSVSGTTTG